MSIVKDISNRVKPSYAFYLLLAMYIVGLIGLQSPSTRSIFQDLTPLNLLLTGMILFHFETTKNRKFFIFLLTSMILGFGIEVLGVKTGSIFGSYCYSHVLGTRVFDVPLIIGLNWAILIYCSGLLAKRLAQNIYLQALIGAVIMTMLDFFIEPAAIQLNFWQWESVSIPFKNYLAWFIFSFGMLYFFLRFHPRSENPIAIKLLGILLAFFVLLNFN